MDEHNDYIDCFKYLPFDEGSLCVLTEGTIKFTRPMDFNDPFECLPVYERNPAVVRKENAAFIDKMIDRATAGKRIPISQRLDMRRKFAHHLANQPGTDQWQEDTFGDMGVCCLSRTPKSILMWSHYAKLHTGLVVGFRIRRRQADYQDETNHGRMLLPLPVSYTETRPVINWNDDDKDKISKMVLNKAAPWAYEQEERVIDWCNGSGIHKYNQDETLSCVIAGAKIDKGDFKKLDRIVRKLNENPGMAHVKLYQARLSDSDYAIEIPGLPTPRGALLGEETNKT